MANRVLEGLNPFSSNSSTTRVAKSLLLMAPGKFFLTSASKAGSSAGLSLKTWATLSDALVSPGATLRLVETRPAGLVVVKAEAEAAAAEGSDAPEAES